MLVGVLLQPGVVRLVEEGQIDLRQIGEIDLEGSVGAGAGVEPLSDGQANTARPGAGDDDHEGRHVGDSVRSGGQRRWRCKSSTAPRYSPVAMTDTGKIAKNLERFAQAIAAHDRENPTHTAYGIGLAHFDMERLGLEEGEEILPGIRLEADGGVTGNFRVLCDGEHEQEGLTEEEEQAVDAIATQALPAIAPGLGAGPREY